MLVDPVLGDDVLLVTRLLNFCVSLTQRHNKLGRWSREPLLKGRPSTVDILLLNSLDQLLLILQTCFFKRFTLTRVSTVLSLPFKQSEWVGPTKFYLASLIIAPKA